MSSPDPITPRNSETGTRKRAGREAQARPPAHRAYTSESGRASNRNRANLGITHYYQFKCAIVNLFI